jgi:hypothetical protein
MNFKSKLRVLSGEGSPTNGAVQWLKEPNSEPPPEQFGSVETVQIEIRLSLVGWFQWTATRRKFVGASLLGTFRDREQR